MTIQSYFYNLPIAYSDNNEIFSSKCRIEHELSDVEKAENYWRTRAEELPPDERGSFEDYIQRSVAEIKDTIQSCKMAGEPAQKIHEKVLNSIARLDDSATRFFNKRDIYRQSKAEVKRELGALNERITATTLNFASFGPKENNRPPKASLSSQLSPLEQEIKERMLEGALILKAAAAPIHFITQATSQAIDTGCHLNPITENFCHGVGETMKEIKNQIPEEIKTFCSEVIKDVGLHLVECATHIEQTYGIPAENTFQTYQDIAAIPAMIPLARGVIGGFLKGTSKGMTTATIAKELVEEVAKETANAATDLVANKVAKETMHFTREISKKVSKTLTDVERRARIVEKQRNASLAYRKALLDEKSVIQRISNEIPTFRKPSGFPEHINQFYAKCEVQQFSERMLGANKKGSIEGHLVYKPMDDGVLFLIKKNTSSYTMHEKIGSSHIINKMDLNPSEYLKFVFDLSTAFAKTRGYNTIYFAWDSTKLPFASVVTDHSTPLFIKGINTLSTGLNGKPMNVIELGLIQP